MAEANAAPANLGPCPCGRGGITLSGTCDQCLAENAAAFWLLMENKISFPGFVRRLRKVKR